MTIEVILLTISGAKYYLADRSFEQLYEIPRAKRLSVRVSRSVDSTVADLSTFPISILGDKIELGDRNIGDGLPENRQSNLL